MPTTRQQVEALVRDSIAELNAQVPEDQQVGSSPDTLLLGDESALDSLGLVTLVFSIEKRVDSTFGRPVAIGNQVIQDNADSPIRTVGGLVGYLVQLLEEANAKGS